MTYLRPFLEEDLEDIQAYLKEVAFDWRDTLTGEEYEVAAAKKYFSDISENKLRVSKDGCNCTVTAQLETLDASVTIKELLECFTRLDIKVYVDFFFMCHSITRNQPEICYPSKPTSYPVDLNFIEKDSDIARFANQFTFVDHEKLLDRHIETRMNGVYESGLSIGRIFGLRMFIESHLET